MFLKLFEMFERGDEMTSPKVCKRNVFIKFHLVFEII
jgi:hypothetical protein